MGKVTCANHAIQYNANVLRCWKPLEMHVLHQGPDDNNKLQLNQWTKTKSRWQKCSSVHGNSRSNHTSLPTYQTTISFFSTAKNFGVYCGSSTKVCINFFCKLAFVELWGYSYSLIYTLLWWSQSVLLILMLLFSCFPTVIIVML